MSWRSTLLLYAALGGCGNVPQPFSSGGSHPRRLAQPPPARLAIPPPSDALLSDAAGTALSSDVVEALVAREVPAVAGPAREGDWRLLVSAELRGDKVLPIYTVQNPKGEAKGSTKGHPVDPLTWSNGDVATLQQVAAADAGAVASLLTSIEAARQLSDPNSLVNRPARIFVRDVIGAPGDGNRSLARNLRDLIPKQGQVLAETADDADYLVDTRVRTAPGAKPDTIRVEIQWIVSDARGRESGKIIQLEEVPPATVNNYWGDVAQVAASQAAGGLRDVIAQQTGSRPTP